MNVSVEMPPDKRGIIRTYFIRGNWHGAGKPRIHVLLTNENHPGYPPSTYTYPSVKGKALLALQIARDPYLATKYGAIVKS